MNTTHDDIYVTRLIEDLDAMRKRRAQARREENDRLINAIHAERMREVERVARMVGGER